jgi:hypothetical protein
LAPSVGVMGVVGACGFWKLESGVEGESGSGSESGMDAVPPASPSSSSSSGDDCLALRIVVAWPFTVGFESGNEEATRPLPRRSPVMFFVPSSRLLSSGSVTAPDVFPAAVGAGTEGASTSGSGDAGDSWSVLVL